MDTPSKLISGLKEFFPNSEIYLGLSESSHRYCIIFDGYKLRTRIAFHTLIDSSYSPDLLNIMIDALREEINTYINSK